MTKHMGNNGAALCGESHLLAYNTTVNVLESDCMECLFTMQGMLLHQFDQVTNHMRNVIRDKLSKPTVVNVNNGGKANG